MNIIRYVKTQVILNIIFLKYYNLNIINEKQNNSIYFKSVTF